MRKYLLFTIVFLIVAGWACKPERTLYSPPKLSDLVDSVIYKDLEFGITRKDLLSSFAVPPQQNIMSEPKFDTDIVEVEGKVWVEEYPFQVYYYFDPQDSLYRVKSEFRTENENEYKRACIDVAKEIYIPYGIPVRQKSTKEHYRLTWTLKNKLVLFEAGCLEENCLLEIIVTERRIFAKNIHHTIPDTSGIN